MSTSDQPDRFQQAKQHFNDLIDLAPTERAAALQTLETQSPELAAEVRRLLERAGEAGSFLDTPAVPEPPRVIGRYKLLQLIGEGGFGAVYMAEQSEPVRRRVALKILKPGMDSRQIIARFEAERQALALMEHANIARVFDAGTSPDGRPFFVMELVNGVPITQFCDENKLPIAERLRLFIDVCHGVHHAHQKGIIHRDLKPSNVLVTLHDGKPVAKVIDFGVAKALDRPLTDKTLFTEYRAMIGTPEYMAPEQAEISGLDIDVRADVYSLGVLLYELLVGVTPFDGRDLRSKAFGEMQRIIREVDPPSPSARLSTLQTRQTVAQSRSSAPPRLTSTIRGELDWICMKCLEKDRRRRYDGASALVSDIEAFLAGDAVQAGPVTTLYRLRKTLRRNRVLVGTVTAVLAALLVGLIFSLVALREARIQRRIADEQRILAQQQAEEATRQAERARFATDFLVTTISFADPYQGSGNPTIAQVFQQAIADLDAGALSPQPEVEAMMRTIVGQVLSRTDEHADATKQLQIAAEFRRRQEPRDAAALARVLGLYASALGNESRYDDATAAFDEADAVAADASLAAVADALRQQRARVLISAGRHEEALPLLESVVAGIRATEPVIPAILADALEPLAACYTRVKRHDDAIAVATQAVALRKQTPANRRRTFQDDRLIIESLSLLASALGEAGRNDEAITLLENAIAGMEQSSRPGLGTLTMLREILARRYVQTRQPQKAADLYGSVINARRQIDGAKHPRVAATLSALGLELYKLNRRDEARAAWLEAWEIVKDRTDMPFGGRADVAGVLAMVSTAETSPTAQELFEFAVRAYRNEPTPRLIRLNTLLNYWLDRYQARDFDRALALSEEFMPLLDRFYPPEAFERSQALSARARSLIRANRQLDEAVQLARQTLEIRARRLGPDTQAVRVARLVLGEALLRAGARDEAIEHLRAVAPALIADDTTPGYIREEARTLLDEIDTLAQ